MEPLWIHRLGFGEIIVSIIGYLYLLFKFLPLPLAFTVLIITFSSIYCTLNEFNKYWDKKGIPNPKGNIIFGHTFVLLKNIVEFDRINSEKYGKNFGTILNGYADFVTSDLDLIKEVLIRNFDAFPDRFNIIKPTDDISSSFITIKEGDDWRRIRHRITPAFTSGKLKKLMPAMHECTQLLIKYLEPYASENKDVPLKDIFSKLTLDVIGKTAFAIDMDTYNDEKESIFLKNAKDLLSVKPTDFRVIFLLLFPNIFKLYSKFTGGKNFIQGELMEYFKNTLTQMMKQREEDPDASKKYNDVFQLLMNAMDDKEKFTTSSEDADIISETVSNVDNSKKLSRIEVLAQIILFLLAGYETTATTLHFICYNLAYKQDIQDKLREEILNVFNEKEMIDYDDMSKLQYMNQVISETLRLYPPALRLNRTCQRDIVINDIEFEKGTCFSIDAFNIHRNPEFYPNPLEFDPDRFTPENKESRHPMAYLAWGAGPRNCIGMRFAEYEMRIALANLIKNYKFLPTEGMPGIPAEIVATGLIKSKIELKCKFQKI